MIAEERDNFCTSRCRFIPKLNIFVSDIKKEVLDSKLVSKYYNEFSNAAFCNLTSNQKLSMNLGNNLGLGTKFCKQAEKFQFKNMQPIRQIQERCKIHFFHK